MNNDLRREQIMEKVYIIDKVEGALNEKDNS